MIAFVRNVRRHQKNDEGASAVEYGLLVAAIAAVIVVVVFALGGLVKNKFNDACNGIKSNGNTVTSSDCK
jgi:pilus assembly protein Flp/PilA